MPIGNMLRDRQEQYVAQKDNAGTWRILDTWHNDLTKLDPEDEIDDTSEAVVVLSEGGFLALIREATRLGVLQNAAMIENEVRAVLADMASIRNTGALLYAGDVAGIGSKVMRLRYADWGANTPFATAALS